MGDLNSCKDLFCSIQIEYIEPMLNIPSLVGEYKIALCVLLYNTTVHRMFIKVMNKVGVSAHVSCKVQVLLKPSADF